MIALLEGGCLCGMVRYRIDAPALSVGVCHCVTCRRAAGAASVAWASVPAAGFTFIAGAPARFSSSTGVHRTHCPICGTSLTFQVEGSPALDVTLGSLDDPEALTPTREWWLSHRIGWQAVDPGRTAIEFGEA